MKGHPVCPKCLSTAIDVTYVPPFEMGETEVQEFLRHACTAGCGYIWVENTKDSEPGN